MGPTPTFKEVGDAKIGRCIVVSDCYFKTCEKSGGDFCITEKNIGVQNDFDALLNRPRESCEGCPLTE